MPQLFQPPVILGIKVLAAAALRALAAFRVTLYKALPAQGYLLQRYNV